jgi:anti-sigma regulatory factor (Ser/Thr protein kinase)
MTAASLRHHALIYSSPADLAATAVPLLREGMERGDALFVATKRANIDALRAALDADAALVQLHDTDRWEVRPADRLVAVRAMVDRLAEGRSLLAFGEPVWSGPEAVRREWARYESVINAVLADAPLLFYCLYDGAALPDDVLEHGRCTHSHVLEAGQTAVSEGFMPPERFIPSLRGTHSYGVERAVHEISLDGDHRAFRAVLTDIALERVVAPQRVDALVIAANEVTTNAVRHGAPPVHARAWATDEGLVCEVSDAGAGIADPLAGWTLPAADRDPTGGWGLPLTRRLVDALEIVPADDGTRVYLHLSLDAERSAA